MKEIDLSKAVQKGVIGELDVKTLPSDTLDKVNALLELIRTKFHVEILIQSDVSLDRGKPTKWQCIIGRRLSDFADAQTFSNGNGDTIGEAIITSLNEFIEYFGIHKRDLLKNG